MKKMEKAVISKEDLLEFLNYNELSAKEKKKYRDVDFEKLLEFADHDLIEVLETCDITKDPRFKIEAGSEEEERIVCKKRLKAQDAGKREKQVINTKQPAEIPLKLKYKCGSCGKDFQCKTHLARHEKFYQERCAYWTARKKKREQPFECDQCGKQYKSKFEVSQHIKAHQEPNFRCGICGRAFRWETNLASHEKTHSASKFKNPRSKIEKTKQIESGNGKKTAKKKRPENFKCETCDKTFQCRSRLARHEKLYQERCAYWTARKKKRDQPFECDQCGKRFQRKESIFDHVQIHSRCNNFECKICFMKFRTRGNLNSHKTRHSEIKFECGTCSKTFKWKWSLIQHEKRHQINQKTIPCIYCQAEFPFKKKLWEHYLSAHKDKRPFACECGMTYKHHVSLIVHRKDHH